MKSLCSVCVGEGMIQRMTVEHDLNTTIGCIVGLIFNRGE